MMFCLSRDQIAKKIFLVTVTNKNSKKSKRRADSLKLKKKSIDKMVIVYLDISKPQEIEIQVSNPFFIFIFLQYKLQNSQTDAISSDIQKHYRKSE